MHNKTKIHQLDITKSKHCIEVKIVFSVNKTDDYYELFVNAIIAMP